MTIETNSNLVIISRRTLCLLLRSATSANASDYAVDFRVFLIKLRCGRRYRNISCTRLAVTYRRRPRSRRSFVLLLTMSEPAVLMPWHRLFRGPLHPLLLAEMV